MGVSVGSRAWLHVGLDGLDGGLPGGPPGSKTGFSGFHELHWRAPLMILTELEGVACDIRHRFYFAGARGLGNLRLQTLKNPTL